MKNSFSIVERYAEIAGSLDKHSDLIDAMRYLVARRFYTYGNHYEFNMDASISTITNRIRAKLLYLRCLLQAQKGSTTRKRVISSAYFCLNDHLKAKCQLDVFSPTWSPGNIDDCLFDSRLHKMAEQISQTINFDCMDVVFSESFLDLLRTFKLIFAELIENNNIRALFVPADSGVFEILALQVFKSLGRPTFLALHGFPSTYSPIDEGRADCLLVFSDAIKNLFVTKCGFDSHRIFVTGHPRYSEAPLPTALINGLDSILVLGKSGVGGLYSHQSIVADSRSLQIEYLLTVQSTLMKIGVKSVRLRPHPSCNNKWFQSQLFSSFYKIDHDTLDTSLKKSSLVIGPSSSVFFDSLYSGVNYIVFEPDLTRGMFQREEVVPPFDGSRAEVPVATNSEELQKLISDKKLANIKICADFVKSSFDLTEVSALIK